MADLPQFVAIVHAAVTWFMMGLIWFVQVVHYPLMADVGADRWRDYQRRHMRLTTFVVAPAMLIEVAAAAMLIVLGVRPLLGWIGGALLVIVWISTFAVQVPCHARLERGFDIRTHRLLVRSNWARTLLWTLRGVVASAILLPP
jgi:uncharacterized membrane protein